MVTVPETGTILGPPPPQPARARKAAARAAPTARRARPAGRVRGMGEILLAYCKLVTSPPRTVEALRYCVMSMFWFRKRTLPSPRRKLAPPVWRLMNPPLRADVPDP